VEQFTVAAYAASHGPTIHWQTTPSLSSPVAFAEVQMMLLSRRFMPMDFSCIYQATAFEKDRNFRRFNPVSYGFRAYIAQQLLQQCSPWVAGRQQRQ
jgi:hypothetical protein